MNSTLVFDRVILVKEFGDKFKKVGEIFEIANILKDSFLLRDSKTRVAIGVISFEDFENHFVHEKNLKKGWTPWTQFIGYDGQNDIVYRTNFRKVQVRFLRDKVRAESCCNKVNEFNLSFGLQIAYLRCLNKALLKRATEYEEALKKIDSEIVDNNRIIKKMINSLEV